MIIFISDLHLTDGTLDYSDTAGAAQSELIHHDISVGAFELFWDDICSIVTANPEAHIRDITVVLLGDILELRSTTRWVASDYENGTLKGLNARPWREDRTRPSQTCVDIMNAILLHNKARLDYLTTRNIQSINPKNGLRKLHENGVSIEFEYVAGNHDSLVIFHQNTPLGDMLSNRLGWKIVKEVGTDSPPGTKFIHDELGIIAEHGHRGDFADFYKNYWEPPLGSLLADTFGRFMYHISTIPPTKQRIKKELTLLGMNFDNVRPSSDGFEWLLGNLPKDPATRNELRAVLTNTFEGLTNDIDPIVAFALPRVAERLKNAPWYLKVALAFIGIFVGKGKFLKDSIGKLAAKTIKRLKKEESADPLDSILISLKDKLNRLMPKGKGEVESAYIRNAQEAIKAPEIKYVVYGHSHQFEISPLQTLGQKRTFYFNSGTWKKTVQKNLCCPECLSFQQWARMTYLIFYNYKNQENKDHVFDLWHGNLQFEENT